MLKQCFCGCSLRTGCFILAYLNLIQLGITCISFIVQSSDLMTPTMNECFFVTMVISFLIGISFAWGVHHEKWIAILPYLTISLLELILLIVVSLVLTFTQSPIFLLILIPCGLEAYIIVVVWSYVIELKQGITEHLPQFYTDKISPNGLVVVAVSQQHMPPGLKDIEVSPAWVQENLKSLKPPPYSIS